MKESSEQLWFLNNTMNQDCSSAASNMKEIITAIMITNKQLHQSTLASDISSDISETNWLLIDILQNIASDGLNVALTSWTKKYNLHSLKACVASWWRHQSNQNKNHHTLTRKWHWWCQIEEGSSTVPWNELKSGDRSSRFCHVSKLTNDLILDFATEFFLDFATRRQT